MFPDCDSQKNHEVPIWCKGAHRDLSEDVQFVYLEAVFCVESHVWVQKLN